MLNKMKKTVIMVMMCLCMSVAAAPALVTYGAVQPQAETQEVSGEQAAVTGDEDSAVFLLLMGGGLLIVLFAVIAAMSTVSGAVSIAVNMDVDGE